MLKFKTLPQIFLSNRCGAPSSSMCTKCFSNSLFLCIKNYPFYLVWMLYPQPSFVAFPSLALLIMYDNVKWSLARGADCGKGILHPEEENINVGIGGLFVCGCANLNFANLHERMHVYIMSCRVCLRFSGQTRYFFYAPKTSIEKVDPWLKINIAVVFQYDHTAQHTQQNGVPHTHKKPVKLNDRLSYMSNQI